LEIREVPRLPPVYIDTGSNEVNLIRFNLRSHAVGFRWFPRRNVVRSVTDDPVKSSLPRRRRERAGRRKRERERERDRANYQFPNPV